MVGQLSSQAEQLAPGLPGRGLYAGQRVTRLIKRLMRGVPKTPTFDDDHFKLDEAQHEPPLTVSRNPAWSWKFLGGVWRRTRESARGIMQARAVQGNVVAVEKPVLGEELDIGHVLERSCLPQSIFAFSVIRKHVAGDGSLMLEEHSKVAEDSAGLPWCEGCLSMSEIGRQLGMLGLVAVSEIDPERSAHFYLVEDAQVDEYGIIMDSRIPLKGIARLSSVESSAAAAELEMWQNNHLLCRLSMIYKVTSSWEDVLPCA